MDTLKKAPVNKRFKSKKPSRDTTSAGKWRQGCFFVPFCFFVEAQHSFRAKVDSRKAPGRRTEERARGHIQDAERGSGGCLSRSDWDLAVRDLPDIMYLKYGTCVLYCALVKWSTFSLLRATLVRSLHFTRVLSVHETLPGPKKRRKHTLVFLWLCGIVSESSCNVTIVIPVQFCIHLSVRCLIWWMRKGFSWFSMGLRSELCDTIFMSEPLFTEPLFHN